jgi:hypothetical protein
MARAFTKSTSVTYGADVTTYLCGIDRLSVGVAELNSEHTAHTSSTHRQPSTSAFLKEKERQLVICLSGMELSNAPFSHSENWSSLIELYVPIRVDAHDGIVAKGYTSADNSAHTSETI